MLFALTFDKLVWGHTPGALSIIGSSLILGSAIYVAMLKEQANKKEEGASDVGERDEERGLMEEGEDSGDEGEVSGETDIPMVSLRA